MKLCWDNVVSTLKEVKTTLYKVFSRLFNVGLRRCINVIQGWKSNVECCFIFKFGSTLFQRWSTTLKQCSSNINILAGYRFFETLILSSNVRFVSSIMSSSSVNRLAWDFIFQCRLRSSLQLNNIDSDEALVSAKGKGRDLFCS